MIRKVADVNEAVHLAEELQRTGEYDWFRGQTQDWPLKSSLARISQGQWDEMIQKFARFGHWIKSTPGLEAIAASTDMTIAVAQHYGLPTNFVDFTTEPSVAGFFASHGHTSKDRLSCIMCLNTKALAQFWELLKDMTDGTVPESKDDLFIRMETLSRQALSCLTSVSQSRRYLVSWSLHIQDSVIDKRDAREIARVLQSLWDGLRLFPYSDEQISEGMGFCAALALEWLSVRPIDRKDWERLSQRFCSDAIEIEFGVDDGSYSSAFVSSSALLEAVRPDIEKFLNPRYADQMLGNISGLLLGIRAPDRLFEFDRLSHLFCTRIAPMQVWMRKSSAIFYSPASLNVLGLP